MNLAVKTTRDPVQKEYLRDNDNFADIVNTFCFKGKQIINPSYLRQISPEESGFYDLESEVYSFIALRDVLYEHGTLGSCMLIGIENQQTKERTMVLRELFYTTSNYKHQWQENDRMNEKRKKMELSTEKLMLKPVMTPVIYFGDGTWEGKEELMELMEPMDDEVRPFINNWTAHIYDAKKVDVSLFRTEDNREVFGGFQKVLACKGNPELLKDLKVKRRNGIVIATLAGCQELLDVITESKEDEINMCESWRIAEERAINKGIAQGEAKGRAEGEESKARSIAMNMLNEGIEIGIISKCSGLSIDEIKLLMV